MVTREFVEVARYIAEDKIIREPGLKLRLEQAAELSPDCPSLNRGRYPWIVERLAARGVKSTRESVKRWFHGENRPREAVSNHVADILGVDRVWLYTGVEESLPAKERRALIAESSGAVNVVAGLILMDGGAVAFPEQTEDGENAVDIQAIMRGVSYSINVALGKFEEDDRVLFRVPTQHDKLIVIGLIRKGSSFTMVELKPEMIATGKRHSGWIDVTLTSDQIAENTIEDFTKRI
jgi:hypothetical protein